MRVLSVGNMYPPHHLGGYELVWQSATQALRDAGHVVRVLTTGHRQSGVEGGGDTDVHRELRWYWRDHGWPRLGLRERVALERHNARVFDRHVAELRPEVVAWWAMGGMSLSLIERARRAGLPAIGFVHDDWMLYGPREDQWLRTVQRAPWLCTLAGLPTTVDFSGAALWLFVSEQTRRRAAERGGLRLARTGVAHSGFDHRYLESPTSQRPWAWRLLNVGRIDARKGIETAIRALAALPADAQLDIIGDGDDRELATLRALAGEQGVAERVTFAGQRDRAGLLHAYGHADVVVFPVVWEEPWGLVPLEAMARGRPVIATGRGGSAEYLRDGENCLLFEPGDPGALAAAVERLANDEILRRKLVEGGRHTAQEHTDAVFNRGVVEALEREVASRGDCAPGR